jgi:hypothetical protein
VRSVERSDIRAAVRGLEMDGMRLSEQELLNLYEIHSKIERFASQVIAEAARQLLETRHKVKVK